MTYEYLIKDLLSLVKQVQWRDAFVEDKRKEGVKKESARVAEWRFDSNDLLCREGAVYIPKIEAV